MALADPQRCGHLGENGAEQRHDNPNPGNLHFYHTMYQSLMFAMKLGLLANNISLMWEPSSWQRYDGANGWQISDG
jgi:hypothetical protein